MKTKALKQFIAVSALHFLLFGVWVNYQALKQLDDGNLNLMAKLK